MERMAEGNNKQATDPDPVQAQQWAEPLEAVAVRWFKAARAIESSSCCLRPLFKVRQQPPVLSPHLIAAALASTSRCEHWLDVAAEAHCAITHGANQLAERTREVSSEALDAVPERGCCRGVSKDAPQDCEVQEGCAQNDGT